MPPNLAAVIYLSFVVWLFRRDFREKANVTSALWLPFFWTFISGGRFISQWLDIFGLNLGGVSVEEGSPVDAIIFFFLIVAGMRVLYQRGVTTGEFARYNRWITIYLCYCLLAIVWSDFPFVAFKRWIKLFGQPVMVLVLLTEPDPMESLARMMKRLAYVFVPVSILFIKYFPQWGRSFDTWSGMPSNSGITMGKNILGCDCFILGLFFIWHFQQVWIREKSPPRKKELYLCLGFFIMIGWLLYMAHSSTSIGVLVLSGVVVVVLNLKFVDRRRISVYLVGLVVVLALAEAFFGIHKAIIEALGRDSTLTGRTDIWQILLHWDLNPILGVGFESFWLGDERKNKLWSLLPGLYLNEAHNGYLETYIQIGLLGLFITLAMLVATYFKITRALVYDFGFGRFRMAYFAAFVVYNWTEAVFRTHCFPFFMFFLIAIDYPARRPPPQEVAPDVLEADTAGPTVQKTASFIDIADA
jgi:O-antigen ligase